MIKPPRAALYARYSSDLQRDASIEDQLRLCRDLAARRGHEVVEAYADRAASGASLRREGLQALLRDARAGLFDVVVAEALDRLSRSQADVAALYERLSFLGIAIETAAEGAVSELHVGLKGTMNALYLKDLAQRTRRGLEGRVRAGRSAGGCAYGYRVRLALAPDGTRLTGEFEVVEAEAAVVRRVLRDYAAGVSPERIAATLNREGVPGPRGRPWGSSTIRGNPRRGTGLINNELYAGRRVWNRLRYAKDPDTGRRRSRPNEAGEHVVAEAPELRIVPARLWQAVRRQQAQLAIRGTGLPLSARHRPATLLSGLMACGACGGNVVIMGRGYVGCSAARRKGDAACANRRAVRLADVEGRVLHALAERLMEPGAVAALCEAYAAEVDRRRSEAVAVRAASEAELARVRRDHGRLVDAILAGVPAGQLKVRMVALDARRQAIEAELAAVTAPGPARLPSDMAKAYRRRARELVAALADERRAPGAREAIRALIERVVLTPEPAPGRPRPPVRIDLQGAPASLLRLAADRRTAEAVLRLIGPQTDAQGRPNAYADLLASSVTTGTELPA